MFTPTDIKEAIKPLYYVFKILGLAPLLLVEIVKH